MAGLNTVLHDCADNERMPLVFVDARPWFSLYVLARREASAQILAIPVTKIGPGRRFVPMRAPATVEA